jgi:hypothetical protein
LHLPQNASPEFGDFGDMELIPTVITLGIHLEGKKIVLAHGPRDAQTRIDTPSRLERYFGRPGDTAYDELTYLDYYANSSLESTGGTDENKDFCDPPNFAIARKKKIQCLMPSVSPQDHELFALRMLLKRFPARSWDELRTYNGFSVT